VLYDGSNITIATGIDGVAHAEVQAVAEATQGVGYYFNI
jgi:hypothetical protein